LHEDRRRAERPADRHVTTTAGVVVAARLMTQFIALPLIVDRYDRTRSASSTPGAPLQVAWAALAGLSGLRLLLSERTRPVGFCILLGTLVSAAQFFAWMVLVFVPNFN
jgi:hypothetical protein